MTETLLPYRATGYFSSLVCDYLEDQPGLSPFYRYPFDLSSFEQAISDRKAAFPAATRKTLSAELLRQYEGLDTSGKVGANIHALAGEDTFCVVTAHQLNIFTGPLYVLIKIANTIHICAELSRRFPACTFVPVYFMGSEDHDFEEIATTQVFQQTFTWDKVQQGPAGRYSTEGLLPLVQQLRDTLGTLPHAADWCELLAAAYSLPTLSAATRYLVHHLFGAEGLVCVDGDAAALKLLFLPVMERELTEGFSYPLLLDTSAALEAAGYHSQLAGRPINLFYARDAMRERIVREDDGRYSVLNTTIQYSPSALTEELTAHPEHFSPNAALRPVYQQTILPALAYVGGGGELSYWLQLKAVFEAAGVFYPMLVLRNSLLLLSPVQQQRMEKLGMAVEDIFLDADTLKKQYIDRQENVEPAFDTLRQELDALIRQVQAISADADPTLEGWAGAEGQKMRGILDSIEKRILKTHKARHEQALEQIGKLKEQLFPGGGLRERMQNGGQWYAQHGPDFLRYLLQPDPFRQQFTVAVAGK